MTSQTLLLVSLVRQGMSWFTNLIAGLILGTGTNASYIERADKVIRWGEGDRGTHQGQVIIDPEMGAFGDNGCIDFIRTQWDNEMDQMSLLPGTT